jgi:hypothetical protein
MKDTLFSQNKTAKNPASKKPHREDEVFR